MLLPSLLGTTHNLMETSQCDIRNIECMCEHVSTFTDTTKAKCLDCARQGNIEAAVQASISSAFSATPSTSVIILD